MITELEVYYNGDRMNLEKYPVSILELLQILGIANQRGIAVAVNEDIIPNLEHEKFALGDRDRVEIILATQGG